MDKIEISKWQHANVMEARHKMWPTIIRHQVNLNGWSSSSAPSEHAPDCGTTACFGGWCAWWPAFRKIGVGALDNGSPFVLRGGNLMASGMTAALYLFGWRDLFESRGDCPADPPSTSDDEYINEMDDYDMVTARLDWLLANCIVVD